MKATRDDRKPTKWVPLWPAAARKIRAPHIAIATIVSTLLIVAIMREHLLWAVASLTGYSAASATTPFAAPRSPPLVFSHDRTFKISIFEDLHFGEAENLDWGPRQDKWTLNVMEGVLDVEGPQIVVLNGDLITGENTRLDNATAYFDMIAEPLVDKGYRWASTYGNHDQGYNLSPRALLEREQSYGGSSLTNSMVSGEAVGVTNYYVPVFEKATDVAPQLILWFFDSQGGRQFQAHDGNGKEKPMPGVVHKSVVDWFKKTSQQLNSKYGKKVPSLGFVHIPVSVMQSFQQKGVDQHQEPGINDDTPLASQGPGDATFVKALLDDGGLLAVFSGHDHGNDFCHPTPSASSTTRSPMPFFCFGRRTGYGGYGHWMRGSRQIVFNLHTFSTDHPSIETWVRLQDNSVSGHVFLNETFGVDVYPKANHGETTLPLHDPYTGAG